MPPLPQLASIAPNPTVLNDLNISLGRNFTIDNTSTGGVNISNLALKSNSTISSVGLNISSVSGSSALTINDSGDINTNGYFSSTGAITTVSALNSTSINVKHNASDTTNVFSVSDSGSIIASDDLKIGSSFIVTATSGAVSSGALDVSGTITATGTLNIGNSNVIIGNDGTISAISNLSIGSGNFNVTATTGNVDFIGDLKINTDKFSVSHTDGSIVSKGSFSGLGDLTINTDQFTVNAATGNVVSKGTFSGLGDLAINTDKFTVQASSGNVSFNGDLNINSSQFTVSHVDGSLVTKGTISGLGDMNINNKFVVHQSDGHATSDIAYSSYVLAASSSDTSTTVSTTVKPSTISSTSTFLTTQEYVDKQIWQQTERINTMLGVDNQIIDNFNNVYKLVDAMAGHSDTVVALQNINDKYLGLVDRASEITTSVSTVVAQANASVPVACLPSVWADECAPLPIPSGIQICEDGWFFQNLTSGKKINWYLPPNGTSMNVDDIQNMYLNAFIGSSVSMPFITIYTKPKASPYSNYFPGFAGAKINFCYTVDTPSLTCNKNYSLYTHTNPMNKYNTTGLKYTAIYTENGTNRNSSSGMATIDTNLVSLDDEVLCFVIGTDSTAQQNDVKFIANSLNVRVKTGTTQFTFSNNGPSTNFMFMNIYKMNSDMSAVTPKNISLFKSYKETYLMPKLPEINATNWN
jgi:hypothetical protein